MTLPSLLGKNDPAPCTVIPNSHSPILFLWPHNGTACPEALKDSAGRPLGIDLKRQFGKASPLQTVIDPHEFHDLYMAELLEHMHTSGVIPGTHVVANYSRLVIDVNRTLPHAIETGTNTETRRGRGGTEQHLIIRKNQDLSHVEAIQRATEIYHPYHKAVRSEAERILDSQGFLIVLEMHSCTKTFNGEALRPEMSTLRAADTRLVRAFEKSLEQEMGSNFVPNGAYDIISLSMKGAAEGEKKHPLLPWAVERALPLTLAFDLKVPYLGVEFRNDTIATPEGRERMLSYFVKALKESFEHCERNNHLDSYRKKDSPSLCENLEELALSA